MPLALALLAVVGCTADPESAARAPDAGPEDTSTAVDTPSGEALSGIVSLWRVDADDGSWTGTSAAFGWREPLSPTVVGAPCASHPWSWTTSFYTYDAVPVGTLDLLLDGEPISADPPWSPGSAFGARASGDLFPGFDLPDAVEVPEPVGAVLPETYDPSVDLVLHWTGAPGDYVTLSLSTTVSDDGTALECVFPDTGEASIPAASLPKLVDSAIFTRSFERIVDVDGAEVGFYATATEGVSF